MATYFGEILPFVSRAIEDEDDDEDEEVPDENDDNLIVSTHHYKAKCSTLLAAIGPIACGFCRAYLFTKETQLVNTIIRKNDEDSKSSEKIAEIYSINEQIDVCLVPRNINSEILFDVTEKLFTNVNEEVKFVILTVNHESQFYTSSDKERPPFLRCLTSSNCVEKVSCPILETPNVMNGLPAAILTFCEVRRMTGLSFVLFADVTDVDSVNTESFLPVLSLQCFGNVQINPDAKIKLKHISSKTIVSSNLYI